MNNKGQSFGSATALVFGIATLIIAAIIAFVIVDTLTGADLMTLGRTTGTTTNETDAWLNETAYPLTNIASNHFGYTLTAIWGSTNQSADISNIPAGYTTSIPLANATTSAGGSVTNASVITWKNVSYSYTYTIYSPNEFSADRMSDNFTEGVDEVSGKLPTALAVAAIVLILAILAVLTATWKKMSFGSSI